MGDTTPLITAKPDIRCYDFWPHGIDASRHRAYQAMIRAGQITRPKVVINQTTGAAAISYECTVPHEWIREEMGRIARGEREPSEYEQISIEEE